MKKIVLATFSHVDLLFVKQLGDQIGSQFVKYRFRHSDEWINSRSGFFKNVFQIISLVLFIYKHHKNDRIIIYGNWLCRIFFLFRQRKNYFYFFNELPCLSNPFLNLYDKFIFRYSDNIIVPSIERMKLLGLKKFHIGSCSVVQNITLQDLENERNQLFFTNIPRAIYIGTIDSSRFGTNTKDLLLRYVSRGFKIDFLPARPGDYSDLERLGFTVLNPIDNLRMHEFLMRYNIGIMSYEPTSLNNFYAAPLKFYEYINSFLLILNLHPNAGIDYFQLKFPALFFNEQDMFKLNINEYKIQREKVLSSAIVSNSEFSDRVLR